MVSNKELESVVEQVNAAYARMEKRIAALEAALAAATETKKQNFKKRLDISTVLWYSPAL